MIDDDQGFLVCQCQGGLCPPARLPNWNDDRTHLSLARGT